MNIILICALCVLATYALCTYFYGRRYTLLQLEYSRLKGEKEALGPEFENLAQRILEHQGQRLSRQSKDELDGVLAPFRERLSALHKKVEESYLHESRERHVLKDGMERVALMGQRMAEETKSLTQALRGDVKFQGNWGELVLERTLEVCGLRAGVEYITQGQSLEMHDDEGRVQRPDVVLMLPGGKHIIVDSKVSLLHYENYSRGLDKAGQEQSLKLFERSLTEHIKDLSGKNYQISDSLNSPDYVIMFIPLEGAFSLALSTRPELFHFAWERKVIMVGPTSLVATLKTVSSVWKQDNQNKNALEIAREAGRLVDDFARLYQEMKDMGEVFTKAQNLHHKILDRLQDGRGNLLGRVHKIQKLGAKSTKELPEASLEE